MTLYLKAKDDSSDRKATILKFTIEVKPRLDNREDMFRIVGEAAPRVDENESIAWRPDVTWGQGYESSLPIAWSLHGADAARLRIDPGTGVVGFITPPDFESGKKAYAFTVTAAAVDGQLVDEQAVTLRIRDVDDNLPSEMVVLPLVAGGVFTTDALATKVARSPRSGSGTWMRRSATGSRLTAKARNCSKSGPPNRPRRSVSTGCG